MKAKYDFKTMAEMNGKTYALLTGLLKGKATSELRKWYYVRKIDKESKGPHIIHS